MTKPQARSIVTKLADRAADIGHKSQDLRTAIKYESWSRGLSFRALAARMELDYNYVLKRVGEGKHSNAIHPAFLAKVIAALHIPPKTATRLHRLGAIEAGWQINEETTCP